MDAEARGGTELEPSGGVEPALHELSRAQRITYQFVRVVFGTFSRLWFRAHVIGRENIPATGAFILAPVHRSNLDTPIVSMVTKRTMRFMGKETLWRTGGPGPWFLTMMGGFPVERGTADRSALRAAERMLADGHPLVMFPEGTRQFGPVVEAELMHDGPSFVAGRAQVPVVPVGLGGTARAMPKGSKMVFPRKVVIVVGPPIPPPAQVNGRVPRRAVREYTEELRVRIQDLYDRARIAAGD